MTQDLSVYTAESYHREHCMESWFPTAGLLRPDQLAAVCYTLGWPFWGSAEVGKREPGLVVSIGCGAGALEHWLEQHGCTVIGVDPSPGPQEIYQGSTLVREYPGGGDTILFVESIEHIPAEQTAEILEQVPSGARVIIVNWPDYHPLELDPPYHITRIDDAVYDELVARFAGRVVLRRGSHLVFERR